MKLKLSDEQLMQVKDLFEEEYKVPICPSVLCGIHILYDGTVALDSNTGLSCHWFWLSEPSVYRLKKVWEYRDYEKIEKDIFNYRSKKTSIRKRIH